MISFTGLASGIDTASIVDSLVSLERSSANSLKRQKSDAEARNKVLDDLRAKLNSLGSAAAGLDELDEVRSRTAESAEPESMEVKAGGGATPGTYSMRVVKLAQAETTRTKGFNNDEVPKDGTLSITVGGDDTIDVEMYEDESFSDLADRINASGARVHATAIHDGSKYRLLITGTDTGEDNAITFNDSSNKLNLAEITSAEDANIRVNNLTVKRSSNTITDLFDDVTLDLKATSGTFNVTVGNDVEGAREKVQGLVDAFNEVSSLLDGQLRYDGTTKGADTLFGDSTLRGLQRELGNLLTKTYGGSGVSAGLLGIELGADGSLSIDATKFDAAMENDPSMLDDLLAEETGMGAVLDTLVEKYADSSTGLLDDKQDSIRDRIDDLDRGIERIDRRADSLQVRLQRQFTALEATMSELQAQTGYLMALFQNPNQ